MLVPNLFYSLLCLLCLSVLFSCSKNNTEADHQTPPDNTDSLNLKAALKVDVEGSQLTLNLGASVSFKVLAFKSNGDKDLFRISTSNSSIFNTEVSGDTLVLHAVKAGTATLTIYAKENPQLRKQIEVTVQTSVPANGTTDINVDTRLRIFFENTPSINTSGEIAIYKKDGTRVDLIKLSDVANNATYASSKTNFVGVSNSNNGGKVRAVTYVPVWVEGNSVFIAPHNGVLEYNTDYYVTISDGAIAGFAGYAANEWTFKTKATAPIGNEVTVSTDGSADFCTVQAALDYVAALGKDVPVTVKIKNGIYKEMLYLRNKNNVTIKGESRDGVIIQYDNCDARNSGSGASAAKPAVNGTLTSGGRSVFLVESCDMLRLENLTLKNTHAKTGSGDQAEFIYFNSTGRLVAVNCNFISAQDTILVKGYCWFYQCLVAGDVDFIWGYPNICLFEQCEIRTRVDVRNGTPVNQDSYVVQARVAQNDKGFVFLNCNFTKEEGLLTQRTYFARSAGQATYDNVAVVNCTTGSHIATAGWYNNPLPNPTTATTLNGWKEYGSKNADGNLANITGRLANSYQITQQECVDGYESRTAVFSGYVNGTSWMQ